MSQDLKELFESNRRWSQEVQARTPDFFSRLLKQQVPQYLWIGCADSRVPANEILGLLPGDVFVHRNVANVVVHSDLNALSVMQYAVDMLKVRHVMVVGHYGCGGVMAALQNRRIGLADNWIRHVQDVRNRHQDWLDTLPEAQRVNALCELNVVEQALNVCQTTIVQDAWQRGHDVAVHGWVYGLNDGLLEDLRMTVTASSDLAAVVQRALANVRSRYGGSAPR